MTNLHLTHEQVTRLAEPFLVARQAGFEVDATSVIVIDFPYPLALKYQHVQLARGLFGRITSDDGKELTVKVCEVFAWLSLA